MKKSLVDIILPIHKKKEMYFRNYKSYCQEIKKIAKCSLKEVRVLVFGSVVKDKHTPSSDIDVLIISNNLPEEFEEREKVKTNIKSKIDPFSPFQLHLATPKEFKEWYENFLKDNYLEI